MSELSHEQREALQALAVRIRDLLQMCPEGRISKQARQYCTENLLRAEFGSLAYTGNLFRKLDPRTQQRIVQFPGTLAHEAIPYALAIGMAGKATTRTRAAELFKTNDWDSESLASLERTLETLHIELREPILHASNVATEAARPDLFVDALRAAYRVSEAVKHGNAAECVESLEDTLSTAFWKCLKRVGWWATEQCESSTQRITYWLFREDVNRIEFVDNVERTRTETPEDRAADAVQLIWSLAEAATTPAEHCLNVYRKICIWLQRIERNELPLSLSCRQTGCPAEYELSLYRWCFDAECLDTTLNKAAERHGLATFPIRTAEQMQEGFNCHPLVAEKRAKDGIRNALRHYRSEWMKAVYGKGELVSGWEVRDTALPWIPIQNTSELREWLSVWLNSIHEARAADHPWNMPESLLEDVQRELRNSERLLEELGIQLPTDFNDEPVNINRAEKQLKSLIRCLTAPAVQTDKQSQDAGDVQSVTTAPAAEREVFIPTRTASRRKKPRGSKKDSDTLIRGVLNSGKSDVIYKWVFANEDDLAELCGCSRGTVMKTEFWKQNRASEQAKWNRENGGRRPKRKSES